MLKEQHGKAIGKYLRISPHKARRVLNQINGRPYSEALILLEFLPYRACKQIWKVLNSAVSNLQYKYKLNKTNLVIKKAFVNEGPKLKRIKPRAKGRTDKILKPTCHITIHVVENIL